MDKFHAVMMRYTLGCGRGLSAYCKWAETQAKVLWALLDWIGKPIAFVLALPALYIIFLVLRVYASRGGKRG